MQKNFAKKQKHSQNGNKMKTLTIKNLVIQIDSKGENPVAEANEAIHLINLALQREPYGLGAQIMETSIDDDDVEIGDGIDEEE